MPHAALPTSARALRALRRLGCAAVVGLGVTGCADPMSTVSALSFGASLLTLNTTGKLPTDIAASQQRREDCSILYLAEEGRYCKPLEEVPQPANLFCYRELGTVECYEVPDPYGSRSRPVQDPRLAPAAAPQPPAAPPSPSA